MHMHARPVKRIRRKAGITPTDYAVMIFAAVVPLLFGFRGRIGRAGGIAMFLCFIAYNWFLLNNQLT